MTPYQRVLSTEFRRDAKQIIAWSRSEFGSLAADRYEDLILAALQHAESRPYSPATREIRAGQSEYRSLHLRLVPGQVRRPRHLLIFRVDEKQRLVTIVRLIHESMDIDNQLATPSPAQDDDAR